MKLFSKPVLKQSIKGSVKLWSILTAVLCFFMLMITASFLRLKERLEAGEGGFGANLTLTGLFANSLYSGMGIIIALIYCVITGNKLVASEIDRGTMAYILNTPVTRLQVILSKLAFYLGSIFAMTALLCLTGLVSSAGLAGGELDTGTFMLLNLGVFLYAFAVGGISYFASCWFNRSGNSMAVGAGVPLACFVLNALSGLEGLEFFKYLSLNTLYNTDNIMAGSKFGAQFIALFVIGVIFYILGVNKFVKKDLPL